MKGYEVSRADIVILPVLGGETETKRCSETEPSSCPHLPRAFYGTWSCGSVLPCQSPIECFSLIYGLCSSFLYVGKKLAFFPLQRVPDSTSVYCCLSS